MSASRPGTMRGPQVKTPPLLLLLLLLLAAALLTTVSCDDYSDGPDTEGNVEDEALEDEGATEDEDTGGMDVPSDPESSSLPESTSSAFTTISPSDITDDLESGNPVPFNNVDEGSGSGSGGTELPPEDTDDSLGLIIIVIPVALVAVIIAVICGIFMRRRLNQKVRSPDVLTEDPYFEGSCTEKVPMPMFEEDVPSVLEVEMDDLDQWMKKDSDTADSS